MFQTLSIAVGVWVVASFVAGPIVGRWLRHRLHTTEKRERLEWWRYMRDIGYTDEGTPSSGRTTPPA